MKNIRPVRGMKDIIGNDYELHQKIINIAKNIAFSYGFENISTPILEYTDVFTSTLGETSDVVHKEMYTFLDKGKNPNSITLRPEFTASIMRAVISNKLYDKLPLRFFSSGPAFRYDRPQAGRLRQFHQLNFEYLANSNPYVDAELIYMLKVILSELQIYDQVIIQINSLGCSETRFQYKKLLLDYLSKYKDQLSYDSQNRLNSNPLRILDSKDEKDQDIIRNAPVISKSYTKESFEYFDRVIKYIELFGIDYLINDKLVRGLDYYCHTVFEFCTKDTVRQSAVVAGGRYDLLAKIMDNRQIPAIGCAAGIERIMMLMSDKFFFNQARPIMVIPLEDEYLNKKLLSLVEKIRSLGKKVMIATSGKLKKAMKEANNINTSHVIILGNEEILKNCYKVKNLDTGDEQYLNFDEICSLFSGG